ncbi:MAG: helix-turn-helix transcriptional regulator [Promethearchaeota archaeon]
MIKRVKELDDEALIADPEFRVYAEKFESEILRGISNLAVLAIIQQYGPTGVHGYEILQELRKQSNDTLIVEEGTLYPLLRKLLKQGIVQREERRDAKRLRKYYTMTRAGERVFNYMNGFFSKLLEALGGLLKVGVVLDRERYLYCPNCANKIDLAASDAKFCEVCGLNIEEYKRETGGKFKEV